MKHDFCWWCLTPVKTSGEYNLVFCSKKCMYANFLFENRYKGGDSVAYTRIPHHKFLPFPWEKE